MRFSDARGIVSLIDELDRKAATLKSKKLGKRDQLHRNTLADRLRRANQPPPTPERYPTGLDASGMAQGDMWGDRWRMRLNSGTSLGQQGGTGRNARRANKFGRGGIKPYRSRIQRQSRRRRTGGVK